VKDYLVVNGKLIVWCRTIRSSSMPVYYCIRKIVHAGFLVVKLKSSLRKFYGRHHFLVDRYGISVSQMTMDMFHLS
jgi:hypothetical protein